ncbi:aminotransferase class IV family protein [Thioclava sp. FR2]|uniref:aminotransferase class IV family protein n=1 Tax=Thioclava sp. FR2 TaxID=3445780 RepID=UPI003EB99F02
MEGTLRTAAGEPGLKLIETMLWTGEVLPRLALHLARLERSAEALGWADPMPGARRALSAGFPDSPARLRLTVDAAGEAALELGALPPAKAEWRVGLAAERLASDDMWLRVKTTKRAVYDRARTDLAEGLDEVVFLNERGEVCDGTITTVFFDRGQGMRTPPLSSGLLPGVLRAELNCPEEILRVEDLPRVKLWVGNALRGLMPAVWVGA